MGRYGKIYCRIPFAELQSIALIISNYAFHMLVLLRVTNIKFPLRSHTALTPLRNDS